MKKFLVLGLACLFLMSISIEIVTAFDTKLASGSEYITIDDCRKAGLKWIQANYPEGAEISGIVPIKNLDDQLNGYCVSFSCGNKDAGYLVLNARKDCDTYIREFCLDGSGIYTNLVYDSQVRSNIEETIYSTEPFMYAIKYEDEKGVHFYNSDSSVLSAEKEYSRFGGINYYGEEQPSDASRGESNKEEYYDAFFNGSSLTNYTTSNNKAITGCENYTPFTGSYLRTGTNTGNCGPTAAANICGYYNSRGKTSILINGNIIPTYDELCTRVGFDINGTGGTTYSNLQVGLRTYVQMRTYTCAISDYASDSWARFKSDFDANKPNLIYIRGNVLENGTWTTVGHFVVGVGYRVLNDGTRYIRVYDGWNSSTNRFLQFDADSLTTFKGASVSVT